MVRHYTTYIYILRLHSIELLNPRGWHLGVETCRSPLRLIFELHLIMCICRWM